AADRAARRRTPARAGELDADDRDAARRERRGGQRRATHRPRSQGGRARLDRLPARRALRRGVRLGRALRGAGGTRRSRLRGVVRSAPRALLHRRAGGCRRRLGHGGAQVEGGGQAAPPPRRAERARARHRRAARRRVRALRARGRLSAARAVDQQRVGGGAAHLRARGVRARRRGGAQGVWKGTPRPDVPSRAVGATRDIVDAVRIDDEPGGGLRLRAARQSAAIVIAVAGAILLCLSRLPEDRTLAFAASTTLVGLVILVGAAVAGTAAHTASLVRRVRGRAFVGTQPDDEGSGHYREAPRRPLVLVDGEPLEGPVRVEARRERPERGPAAY